LPGKSTMERIKDGLSDTVKTTEVTSKEKERMDTSDLSLMSHSMPSSKVRDQLDKQSKSSVEETSQSKSSRETRRLNNSTWMQTQRPSSQLLTRTNLGILRTQVNLSTCRSGRQTEDGTKCSSMLVTASSTKEDNTSAFRTTRTSSYKRKVPTHSKDGMSDTSRMSKTMLMVNITQIMASTVTDSSISFHKEMEDISKQAQLSVEKQSSRQETDRMTRNGSSTAKEELKSSTSMAVKP